MNIIKINDNDPREQVILKINSNFQSILNEINNLNKGKSSSAKMYRMQQAMMRSVMLMDEQQDVERNAIEGE